MPALHKTSLSLLSLLFLAPGLPAQNSSGGNQDRDKNASEAAGHRRFWQAQLPGGHYMVALDRITSISRHTYLLDGTIMVTEVTVDTLGVSLARFYQLTPASEHSPSRLARTVGKRGKEILDKIGKRTGMNASGTVHKKYPVTTHAKTVEFQLSAIEDLDALYKSLRRSWEQRRGRKFTIK